MLFCLNLSSIFTSLVINCTAFLFIFAECVQVSAAGASDVQVQIVSAEAWGGGLEQREPFLQLGRPKAQRRWGEGGPGQRQAPEGAGLQVRLSIHLHTQPLHPDSMAGAGSYGSGVGPRG